MGGTADLPGSTAARLTNGALRGGRLGAGIAGMARNMTFLPTGLTRTAAAALTPSPPLRGAATCPESSRAALSPELIGATTVICRMPW